MEDWAEIRRLNRAEQMPIRAIARHLGISIHQERQGPPASDSGAVRAPGATPKIREACN
ncbi:hypothetical protein [Streptomyces sp. NPDC051286]|uniref:hypothetical protein n=1 Tax=Streptomyces sp. NPDC051286 TaxID=3365647 RepID=UPI00379F8533